MPFDSASMDLEKAMGRVAETGSNVFTLQCVSGGLERHHAKRMVQFLRKQGIVELSLFRTDLGTHADATTVFCRFIRSSQIHTIRLRSVMLNANQTRQVLNALAEHERLEEIVYDGAALNQSTEALVGLLERNVGLRKLDMSCEMWGFGSTENLARGLGTNRNIHHLSLNGCQLEDADARPVLLTLADYPALTHLELRYNQLRERSLPALAQLLIRPLTGQEGAATPATTTPATPSPPQGTQRVTPPSTRLHLLDLARNATLFGDSTADIDVFCQALGDNTNLKSLYLRNCGVTAYALEQVAAAAVRNTTLKVLDLRQLAIPIQGPFPHAFLESMAQWKGIETLDLDFAFSTDDAATFLRALERNTSLLSGSLDGLPAAARPHVDLIFRRNRWWKRARDLLADNHPALYASQGGAWMHALARMKSDIAGDTAAFCTLRERLSLWLESNESSDNDA